MSDNTAIEWADASWNPIRVKWRAEGPAGHNCLKLSPGCEHCYASRMQGRFGGDSYAQANTDNLAIMDALVRAGTIYLDGATLLQPGTNAWQRPRLIFPCSMTDLFAEWHPLKWINAVWEMMHATPQHQYLVLTKRPKRMQEFMRWYGSWFNGDPGPLPNVWLGVTVENDDYTWRVLELAKVPAAVHWVSAEPLMGPLPSLRYALLDWLVIGGLSGGPITQRLVEPCPQHIRFSLTDTCARCNDTGLQVKPQARKWISDLVLGAKAAGVPVFFKQNGGPTAKAGGRRVRLPGGEYRVFSEYPPQRLAVPVR